MLRNLYFKLIYMSQATANKDDDLIILNDYAVEARYDYIGETFDNIVETTEKVDKLIKKVENMIK